MKITGIETIPFSIPGVRPLGFATGRISAADHVLVRVHTDEGLVGQAESSPRVMTYGETQASVVAVMRQWIEPALLGLDPLCVEQADFRLRALTGNHTAKAAVDLALHDLIGQALGQSCAVLLGGFTERVRVSHMLGFLPSPAEVAAEAAEMRDRYGITAFKIKVGHGADIDLATCAAVREVVGPDGLLYADANTGYSAEAAIRIVPRMAEFGIAWIEEPNLAADRIGRRMVVERVGLPVAGDESCRTLAEASAELSDGRCQIVSIKTARTGFTVSRRILGLCAGLGAPVVCGSQLEGGLGTLAQLAFVSAHAAAARFPAELTSFSCFADDLLISPPVITGGEMAVSPRPGLGIEVDDEKLTRYRLDVG